ncbi:MULTISPECIES: hypothetical protein [unclassified Streptomyces]|uniref:hypothetical protein n=1 Tax=unclassified Streptomyces TaxID=2593676 RepID=UPI000DD65772|nr:MULTISPECIES: hypothetical protein [unclassified Streptomyces]QZZ27536.1 hypothetical protein A7X85_15770 [Streptomyces sp. ST1015]
MRLAAATERLRLCAAAIFNFTHPLRSHHVTFAQHLFSLFQSLTGNTPEFTFKAGNRTSEKGNYFF